MRFDAGRRAILASLGMAVAGCAAKAPQSEPSASSRPSVGRTATPSRPAEPAPETPPYPSPALPTRDEIVETFTGQTPRQWGLQVPGVISSLSADAGGAVLTLDYCGGPGGSGTDHTILDLLRKRELPATLFLNARWIAGNRALAMELAEDPLFHIANHGTQHRPLSVTGQSAYGIPGTTGPGEVYDEIMINTAVITDLTGEPPRFFRSGTAHLDEIAAQICHALGQIPIGFSINADAGATYPAHIVTQEIVRAGSGDIIIAHGNHPAAGTGAGLSAAAQRLQEGRTRLVALPPRLQPGQ